MSVRVYDFRCAAGHIREQFVDALTEVARCPECGQPAMRQLSAPRPRLEGITGAFPSASDKWVRDRDSKMAQEKRNVENHGTYR